MFAIKLDWDAPTRPEVIKTNVYQSRDGSLPKPWTLLGSTALNVLQFNVDCSKLTPGGIFFYTTFASATEESVPSQIVSTTVPVAANPLPAPTLRITVSL
jgi:hypothetical protein